MDIRLMNVKRQHEAHAAEYEEAALRVLRSGCYIGGEEVSAFESEFAAYAGAEFAVSCGNGTDALILALRALGIGAGDEVITVSWTFCSTAESIAIVGAKPVFVDVSPESFCIDPDLIERAVTSRTKAVLPVHFYGQSCDMTAIRSICRKHGLKLIADCAQATGTSFNGERRGILGDISCFSFFPTKNLGCAGDGGMILTDDESLAGACRSLKVHGSGASGLEFLRREYEKRGEPFPENMPDGTSKYYNYLIGYNSRLDAVQAAILRRKLKYIDEFVDARRANAAYYNDALRGTGYTLPKESTGSRHSYYIYALKHRNAGKIMAKLTEAGIQCGVYYPVPLHMQGAFAYLGYRQGDFPVTEELARTTCAIPVYPELLSEEREFIVKILREADDE
ncbi:DegT/DnrJ/EryC1/StrS family aminotransferase [bacterium]|nr:DegT/DnrJ/EryC1/StrS family aminotransferase [bacterium]